MHIHIEDCCVESFCGDEIKRFLDALRVNRSPARLGDNILKIKPQDRLVLEDQQTKASDAQAMSPANTVTK
jgi:hypothetical protein